MFVFFRFFYLVLLGFLRFRLRSIKELVKDGIDLAIENLACNEGEPSSVILS